MYWSAVRGFGKRALADGLLTMIDIQTGSAAACTVPQCAELMPPLPETRTNSWGPDEPLRFSVEVERSTVAWLCALRLIPPNAADDLMISPRS